MQHQGLPLALRERGFFLETLHQGQLVAIDTRSGDSLFRARSVGGREEPPGFLSEAETLVAKL
jgi:hypothetical protein